MDRLLHTSQTGATPKDNAPDSVENSEDRVIAIEQAEYVEDYILQLKFSDGKEIILKLF